MEPENRSGGSVAAAAVVVVVVAGALLVSSWADHLVGFGGESLVPTHDEEVASRSVVLIAGLALLVLTVAGAVARRPREVLLCAVVLLLVAVVFVL